MVAREQRYEWEYVYGAVAVVQGQAQFQRLPAVSLEPSRGFLQSITQSDHRVMCLDGITAEDAVAKFTRP